MRSILRLRGRRLVVATTGVFVLAGGISYAAIPDSDGVIHGCYKASGDPQAGQLRVIDSSASCRSNELPIQWNEEGAPGAPGAPGTPGEDGTDGSSPTVAQLAAGHSQCPAGGAAITDAAGTTAYVCSGQDGQAGADGAPFSGTFTSPNGQYSISVTDAGVTVASPDSSIRVTDSSIKVESLGTDLLEIKGSNVVNVQSGAGLQLKGGGSTTVEGAGSLVLKGAGLVSINGGAACPPAARVGDSIAGSGGGESGPVTGNIVSGSSSVCIG